MAIRALFEQALKIDPDDPEALGGDAATYLNEKAFGWANPETDYRGKSTCASRPGHRPRASHPVELLDEKRVVDDDRPPERRAPRRCQFLWP